MRRLLHGDCLEVLPTLEAGSVDAIICDPPYGIGFPYHGYDDTRENLKALIDGLFRHAFSVTSRMYILCGITQTHLYPSPDWTMCVTWNTTGSFGAYGYAQWMPVLCYGKDLAGFGNVNGVMKSDTIRISGGGGVGFMRTAEEKKHTCPKPLTIMEPLLVRLTQPGATILDPFMGSGTTGVACVNTGRDFIGIERDAGYYAIAERRIAEAQMQTRMAV